MLVLLNICEHILMALDVICIEYIMDMSIYLRQALQGSLVCYSAWGAKSRT